MPSKVASSRKDFERLEKVIKNIAKSVNTLQTSNKKLGGGVDELTQKFKKQENQQKKNGQKTRILTGAFAKTISGNIPAAPVNTFVPPAPSSIRIFEPFVPSCGIR